MLNVEKLRASIAAHIGQVMTPEIACAIEMGAYDFEDHAIATDQFAPVTYDGIRFQAESLRAILAEIHPLHEAHYRETEQHRLGIPLNMNYAALAEAERVGNLLQFTARDCQTGALVGNLRMFLHDSLHTQTPFAAEDTMFILAPYRAGWRGVKFLRYVEAALYQFGTREIRVDAKLVNRVNQLLKRCGFMPASTGFVKFL